MCAVLTTCYVSKGEALNVPVLLQYTATLRALEVIENDTSRQPGLTLKERARSSENQKELWREVLPEAPASTFLDTSLWRYSRHVQIGGDRRADPEHTWGITYPIWPGGALKYPRRIWEDVQWWINGLAYFAFYHWYSKRQKMDEKFNKKS